MNQQLIRPDRLFRYTVPALPLSGRKTERKVVTELAGPKADALYERLSRAGFRRSHSLAYRPACPNCSACVPVRIAVSEFQWTKSFRRVARTNSDLTADDIEAIATVEQYRLFSLSTKRHEGGEMSGMDFSAYRAMIEDTPVSFANR